MGGLAAGAPAGGGVTPKEGMKAAPPHRRATLVASAAMPRRTVAAFLLLTTAWGCATVSESDGVIDNLDAAANDLGKPFDAPADVASDEADDAAVDAPADVADDRAADVPIDRGVDVGVDRPDVVDLGPGVECEGTSTRACYTGTPATRMVGLCFDGFQRCAGGRWAGACNGQILPAVEACNGIDDDCDMAVDNIPPASCYTGPPGTQGVGICRAGTYRCEGDRPICSQVVPQAAEMCGNRLDDNCNGRTDEDCP